MSYFHNSNHINCLGGGACQARDLTGPESTPNYDMLEVMAYAFEQCCGGTKAQMEHGDEGDGEDLGDSDSDVAVEEERPAIREPHKYAVVLHNDNYTTMEFVVEVLQKFFAKSESEATAIMLKIHSEGKGVAGVFSFEIAETKAMQVTTYARKNGYPLRATTEPVEAT